MHEIGQIIKATISGIKPYGVFVKLDEDFGFCHISNVSNNFIKDLNKLFYIGQFVNVKIVEITEQGKINVSIKDCENKIINKLNNESKIEKNHKKETKTLDENKKPTFEEMLLNFMKTSDDKISSMNKRKQKNKRK